MKKLIKSGDIISYLEMCQNEGCSLQRGMNFHLHGKYSVILMSRRSNAPYVDNLLENGKILIYEGHDTPKSRENEYPKLVDQLPINPNGTKAQNGLFYEAATRFKQKQNPAELVRVYEKIQQGIWAYNGLFKLIDAWQEISGNRNVFKFKLELTSDFSTVHVKTRVLQHNRMIPSDIKLAVWKRDQGRCVLCGSKDNLHFDHDIPFSKGGTSIDIRNVRLLCVRHNLAKRDKIE